MTPGLLESGMTPAGLGHGGLTPAALHHGGMTPGLYNIRTIYKSTMNMIFERCSLSKKN